MSMNGDTSLNLYFPGIMFTMCAACSIAKYHYAHGICLLVRYARGMCTMIFQWDSTKPLED
jgi:hypothetical protein